ncbi:MAG: sensor histidine kinase [Janthinobacterium lividum]
MPATLASAAAQRQIHQRVLALVAAGFLAVLAAGVAAGLVILQSQTNVSWVTHTYQVEGELRGVELSVERMRTAAADASTGSIPYAAAKAALHTSIEHVASLTVDNVRQQVRLPALRPLERRYDQALAVGGAVSAKATHAQLTRLTGAMLAEEERLLDQRRAAERTTVRRFWLVLTVTGALLVTVATASVLTIRRYTRDLTRSQNELRRLNVGLEDAVRERTVDLQRANDEIQRFAYIVSHDLRSPLVNVMGFTAEIEALGKPLAALIERADAQAPGLVDGAVRVAVTEDLPEATGFIRSSTQKMDRLINAILRLSREGRRSITPELVDLGAIAEGAIASVRHRLDERGATATVKGSLASVVTDRLAAEQIISNLIDNAVKYLKPGRPGAITVTGGSANGRVTVSVADNGRGIDPRDHERVFDLFRRSGAQDQPGEGIGLAHVRASAYRLGGWIDLQSELDHGATFTLHLPSTPSDHKATPA